MSRGGRTASSCPCGTGRSYASCCRPLHLGRSTADTAEQLMRSRYSAFVRRLDGYLLRTWDPSTAPAEIRFRPGQEWVRLEIVGADDPGALGRAGDDTGTVEFVASYEVDGRPGTLHERSRFVRHDGEWVYLDGVVDD